MFPSFFGDHSVIRQIVSGFLFYFGVRRFLFPALFVPLNQISQHQSGQ